VPIDSKPILDGIPLVQGAWAGASPEVQIETTWPTARIEDFEARYKDLVLRPKTAGDEVSQALSKDSFEAYETGTFPAPGGWRAPGLQTADPAASSSRVVIDETDSATGLLSLLLETDGKEELIVSKRLSLPARVPFGVSEGNFSIGAGEIVVRSQSISRSRLMDEQRREREGKEADREADRARARATETAEPAGRRDRASDSSSGTAKMMSASPVGNFYIYSFDGKLLQVYDVYGHLLKDYIYMGDRLIAEYDYVGSRYLYYTPDQINTTRVVTDGVGNIVYSAVHDPYGGIQQTGAGNTYDPQLKFSGKERDAESQLDYFGARYYDRSQYRFISVDPVVDKATSLINGKRWNLYSYCIDNPITYVDTNGDSAAIFDKATNRIAVMQGNGQLWDWFPASNNVGSNGYEWPQGHYAFAYWAPPENAGYFGWDFDPIDSYGAYVFNVKGHSGMSIHAGMMGVFDNAGHYGWECWTDGCIRTVQEVMEAFNYLESMGDSLTDLFVFNDYKAFVTQVSIKVGLALTIASL